MWGLRMASDLATASCMQQTRNSLASPAIAAARRLDFIDALRGLSCLWVCFCHVEQYWCASYRPAFSENFTEAVLSRLASTGAAGVDIFIVLSGFCLYWPLIQTSRAPNPLSNKKFFIRRSLRLLPVYYVALSLCIVLALVPVTQKLVVPNPINWVDITTHFLLLQTFSSSTVGSINGSFWSLALEWQLYLFFPLAVFLVRKTRISYLLVLALLFSLATWYVSDQLLGVHIYGLLPARFVQFAMGMIAADIVRWQSRRFLIRFAVYMLPILPVAMLSSSLNYSETLRIACWGLAAVELVVVLSLLPESIFKSAWRMGLLARIGVISYSIYLLQQPFLLLTTPLLKNHTRQILMLQILFTFVALPVLLVLSWLLYKAVEQPCMRLGKTWSQAIRA